MSPRKVPCAGCKAIVSEDGAYMRCKKCKQIYDIFCANINKDMFDKSSDELKKRGYVWNVAAKYLKVIIRTPQCANNISNGRTKVGSSKGKSDSPAVTLTHAPKKPEGDLPTARPSVANLSDESTDRDAWEEVRRKWSRAPVPSILRGTAAPGSTQLQASERWSYLHLYYVQEGTTSEQVRNHLRSICDNNICTVDELKSRGRYASFKLGVPSKNVDSVMSSENWAENICVKPWRQNFRAKAKSAPSPSPIS
ncbi:hypothetical protein ACJJTC_013395 [Scirpophaga incertulas]